MTVIVKEGLSTYYYRTPYDAKANHPHNPRHLPTLIGQVSIEPDIVVIYGVEQTQAPDEEFAGISVLAYWAADYRWMPEHRARG